MTRKVRLIGPNGSEVDPERFARDLDGLGSEFIHIPNTEATGLAIAPLMANIPLAAGFLGGLAAAARGYRLEVFDAED